MSDIPTSMTAPEAGLPPRPNWPTALFGRTVRVTHPEFMATLESPFMSITPKSVAAGAVVCLQEITRETLRLVSLLDVGPGQEGLVAPNAFSVAQAHFASEAWFRAIYADEIPVGFAMLEDPSQAEPNSPAALKLHQGRRYMALWRFMIDYRYQGLGYGRAALQQLIAHVRSRPGVEVMLLSFVPKENNPELFYASVGFTRTGEIDDGEVVMQLVL